MPAPEKPRTPEQGAPPTAAKTRHHWWRWVVAVVAVVLAIHVAGGWYFAGRIDSGALDATPGAYVPAFDDLVVVSATDTQVVLRKGPDGGVNFDAAGRYAMNWQGGWGHIGPATVNADGTVTRSLEVVEGTTPRPGQGAGLSRSYWLGDPTTSMGLPKEDVTIAGAPAWYFPAGVTAPTTMAIFVHGQNGTRLDGLRFVDATNAIKLPTLVISYRNDAGAPKDPSGRLQYGRTEWRDLEAAVDWALARGATKVVLAGQSMGGGIVASFLENSSRRSVVSAVVFDAPMLSLSEMVTYGARDELPGGLAVPGSVIWSAERIASLRYGIDWGAVDYLDDTSWLTVPTLVTHGAADPVVPVSVSESLKQAKPDLVTLQVFPNALHTESWNFDPARWTSEVRAFLAPQS